MKKAAAQKLPFYIQRAWTRPPMVVHSGFDHGVHLIISTLNQRN